MSNFQVIFQSKTTDGTECSPDMVLLNGGDLKQLKIRSGSYVSVHCMSTTLLCRAWVSKKSTAGVITLNKLWIGSVSERKVVVQPLSSPRIVECSELIVSVKTESGVDSSKAVTSTDHLRALLVGLPIGLGTKIVFSICNVPYIAEIVSSKPAAPEGYYSRITERTAMALSSGAGTSTCEVPSSSISFSGYSEQRQQCLQYIRLGLQGGGTELFASVAEEQLLRPPKGVLLFGPPGTGKTRLMRSAVQALGCAYVELSPSILLSSVEGDAELRVREAFAEAHRLAPCVVLVDDMELLCPSRSKADVSDLQKRVVSCLLTLVDGVSSAGRVVVVGTSCRPNDIDPALRRPGRLDKEIEIGVPSSAERRQILGLLLAEAGVSLEADGDSHARWSVSPRLVDDIASLAHGMVGADLLLLVKEAFFVASRRQHSTGQAVSDVAVDLANEFESMNVSETLSDETSEARQESSTAFFTDNDFRSALASVSPSALREVVVEVPQVRWTDIGGMEPVKQSLREVVEWPLLHPELFRSLNISPPKGVLLYGPPGCSKTLMAKALATESSMNFLAVRGPELLSKWLGDSEKAVQALFRRARAAAPSIVFFDEIDALAGKRGTSSSGVSDRVLSQLLTELDGIQGLKQVIVIAATNRPDMLDAALIRPGRIDRKIYVPPPDDKSREQIFSIELSKVPKSASIALPSLVSLSEGFSGAEIVAVCSEAAMLAMEAGQRHVSECHLLTAIGDIKPQITQEMLDFYENFKANL